MATTTPSTRPLWIDWLGNVHSEKNPKFGYLVCGPDKRGDKVVYILETNEGRMEVDWKDILIQLQKGGEVQHYRGIEE